MRHTALVKLRACTRRHVQVCCSAVSASNTGSNGTLSKGLRPEPDVGGAELSIYDDFFGRLMFDKRPQPTYGCCKDQWNLHLCSFVDVWKAQRPYSGCKTDSIIMSISLLCRADPSSKALIGRLSSALTDAWERRRDSAAALQVRETNRPQ